MATATRANLSFFQVSQVNAGSQCFEPSYAAFTGHKKRGGWEVKQLGQYSAPTWDPVASKARI